MARKQQKRDKRSQQSFTSTPIIIDESFLIPLSPFYLFFRKEYATLMGQKLPDDQLDQILQKEEEIETGNMAGFYFFFGLCSTIYGSWTYLEDDEQAPYIHDYEKLMAHFDKQKKKCLTSIATITQLNSTINSDSIGKKYRVDSLIFDEFYTVCEFLNAPSIASLAQTCKHFAGHFRTLLSNLLNSDNQASFIEYFRKKKIDPRLTLLLHDNDISLTPQLKEFKDSLDIRLVIDFKALNRQPGGNTDDFITRQVVLLKSNVCKTYKSNIRNYDDTLYDNDIIIPIKNQNPNQAKEVIVSVCRVIAECERTPYPLIIKPKLNPQYLFTSHDQTGYDDSPEDFSQIAISVFNNSEKFFDFAKLSVILKEFDIIPYQMSKSAIELVEKSTQFCNASVNNDDLAGEFQNNNSINILARKQKQFGRPGGMRVNASTGLVEKMDNFDEDSSEEDEEEESDEIDLELENEKLWRKFDKKLSSNTLPEFPELNARNQLNSMDASNYIGMLCKAIYEVNDEQLRRISQLSIQLILGILCKGKYFEESMYWFTRTSKIVKYNEIHLQSLLNLLMDHLNAMENTCMAESIIVKLSRPNIIQLTKIVKSFLSFGKYQKAISLVENCANTQMDDVLLVVLLSYCTENKLTQEGSHIHTLIKNNNIESLKVNNSLINFYAKCGNSDKALTLFEKMKKENSTDVVSWNCVFLSILERPHVAISLFNEMEDYGIEPTVVTLNVMLNICTEHCLKDIGISIHEKIIKMKMQSLDLDTALVKFYMKCGMPVEALNIQRRSNCEDVIYFWNCAIQSLSDKPDKAIPLFKEMLENCIPTDVTFNIVLGICDKWSLINEIDHVKFLLDNSESKNVKLYSTIMNIYNKNGYPEKGLQLFYNLLQYKNHLVDVVTWTCAIQSLSKDPNRSISLFKEMEENGILPTDVTLNIILKICAEHKLIEFGIEIHEKIKKMNIQSLELDNGLMTFYTKCGMADQALEVFEEMKLKDVISLTCAIQALVEQDCIDEAFKLIEISEIPLDDVAYVILLTACANNVSIEKGEHVIKLIESSNIIKDHVICGAIANFYAKIGNICKAQQIFLEYQGTPHVELFSVMIDAYAKHGMGKEALNLYDEMLRNGIQPVMETIASVLMACSHMGMIKKAREVYLSTMNTPIWCPQLRTSMIDVLSRSGLLNEAELLIGDSKYGIDWATLLGGCRIFNDLKRAERVFNILIEIEKHASYYVIMSYLYVWNGELEKANKVRELMKEHSVKKTPAITTMEIKGKTYHFYNNEDDQKEHVYKELDKLLKELSNVGYIPDTKWVTSNCSESDEIKKHQLGRHSEKIALAFAFISLPAGSPIVMRLNLRMCGDCHASIKLISQIRKCDITVRDSSRFHHFSKGKCSCGDYF